MTPAPKRTRPIIVAAPSADGGGVQIVQIKVWLLGISPMVCHSRLVEIAADRNSPQKHVWRAQIVLLSAQCVGTNEIMRVTGKAKT